MRDILKSHGFRVPLIEEKVAAGHLGAKTSVGLYDYGGRSPEEIQGKRDWMYW